MNLKRVTKPFPPIEGELEAIAANLGCSLALARDAWEFQQSRAAGLWEGDGYRVVVEAIVHPQYMYHVFIRREDGEAVGKERWETFIAILDTVLPGFEAVEVYPKEERRFDESNTYHLWAAPNVGIGYDKKKGLVF